MAKEEKTQRAEEQRNGGATLGVGVERGGGRGGAAGRRHGGAEKNIQVVAFCSAPITQRGKK